jgi:hypothetical protein
MKPSLFALLFSLLFFALPTSQAVGQVDPQGHVGQVEVQSGAVSANGRAVSQRITFPRPSTAARRTTPYRLQASATSGLPVRFVSLTKSICTITPTGILSPLKFGTCKIRASQAGKAGRFKAAPPIVRSFKVKYQHRLTFAQPGDHRVGDLAVGLEATSNRGQAVLFASTTPSVCSVGRANGTVTLVAPGTC